MLENASTILVKRKQLSSFYLVQNRINSKISVRTSLGQHPMAKVTFIPKQLCLLWFPFSSDSLTCCSFRCENFSRFWSSWNSCDFCRHSSNDSHLLILSYSYFYFCFYFYFSPYFCSYSLNSFDSYRRRTCPYLALIFFYSFYPFPLHG